MASIFVEGACVYAAIPQSASPYKQNGQAGRARGRGGLDCLNLSSLMRARIVHRGSAGTALRLGRHHVHVRLRIGTRAVLTPDTAARVRRSVRCSSSDTSDSRITRVRDCEMRGPREPDLRERRRDVPECVRLRPRILQE